MNNNKIDYLLFLADSNLILSQRNAEWCGHGPVLEQDIAITNITLDLLGQARLFYQCAAAYMGNNATEDSLAYLRNEREFKNLLLCELPRGDWAFTTLRQFFFSSFAQLLYTQLLHTGDAQVAAIAEKSLKEINYHVRWSAEWVIRLGDGTEESNQRMQQALKDLWPYSGEMFIPAAYENEFNFNLQEIQNNWLQKIGSVLGEATLTIPENTFMQSGGKTGVHTEHMGYLLAEMQVLQRSYPGAAW